MLHAYAGAAGAAAGKSLRWAAMVRDGSKEA
jgi:hypothetical protein